MASGDTKTEAMLNVLGNGGSGDQFRGCCNTKTQNYILDAIDRINNIKTGAIEGYYYNGEFYADQAHTELIEPFEGGIFYDLGANALYVYDGYNYVAVGVSGIGRFLSGWNATTGLPVTNPGELPYTYTTGDYYIVSAVDSTTNYKPNGSTYDGTASTTVETGNVQVNDFYFYDGTQWLLLKNNTPTTTETLYFTLADDSVVSKTFYIKNS